MELFRCGLDKFEEPLAPRRDMSTVLDIGGRPETLGRGVVPLVEERVERLQDKRFVLCFGRGHGFTRHSPEERGLEQNPGHRDAGPSRARTHKFNCCMSLYSKSALHLIAAGMRTPRKVRVAPRVV